MKVTNMMALLLNATVASSIGLVTYTAYNDNLDAISLNDASSAVSSALVESISADEKFCLQQNMYFEARNQSVAAQKAVAWVTLNRVTSPKYPSSICDVVWQRKQFSWTHDGKSDRPGNNILEQQAWNLAGDLVDVVLYNSIQGEADPTDGSTHYHATSVMPYWASQANKTVAIEEHVFYKFEEK